MKTIIIPFLYTVYPTLATLQTKRFTELIKSYQNRPNVGMALLWALGQCGRKDLSSGLKIWSEYMRPLLRLRHYTRFVVTYLSGLLKIHASIISSGNLSKGPRVIYPSQYFLMFDTIFNEATTISKESQKELLEQYPTIKKLAIGDCSTDHELFPEFLRRLDDFLQLSNGPTNYKSEILASLSQCVANNPIACVSHWQQMYRANFYSSSLLLGYLDANWSTIIKSASLKEVSNLEIIFELLSAFKEYNDSCNSQKDGLTEASKSCKSLLKKVTKDLDGNKGWFPWKLGSIVLLAMIVALVNKDVQRKGSFKKSSTGLFLQDINAYDRAVEYYGLGLNLYLSGKEWTLVKLPIYYEVTKENAGPFMNNVLRKIDSAWVEAGKTVEYYFGDENEYLPEIKRKLTLISNEAAKIGKNLYDGIGGAIDAITAYTMHFSKFLLEFLKETYEVIRICIQDIINGKIDLTDVYNGCQKLFQKAVLHSRETYEYAKNYLTTQMK